MFSTVSKRIVGLHGGNIGFQSDGPGKGSLFYVELPLSKKSSTAVYRDISRTTPSEVQLSDRILSYRITPSQHTETGVDTHNCISNTYHDEKDSEINSISTSGNNNIDLTNPYKRNNTSKNKTHYHIRSLDTLGYVAESDVDEEDEEGTSKEESDSIKSYPYINKEKNIYKIKNNNNDHIISILLVDDVPSNRKMMKRILTLKSYHHCIEAENGEIAVQIVKDCLKNNKQLDVILMDYVMPVMDGPTATKEIRALGFVGPIIGVTGNALVVDINNFLSHGANKVLSKPLDLNKFLECIGGIVTMISFHFMIIEIYSNIVLGVKYI